MILPLILGVIGAVIGNGTGYAIGASVGYAIGSLIGTMLQPTKLPSQAGPRLEELSLQTSSSVADLGRTYGTVAHKGNMIWAKGNQIDEVVSTSTKKKKVFGITVAKQKTTTYTYYLTCAVAFCKVPEGSNLSVLRVWIGDKLVYNVSNDDVGTLVASSEFADSMRIYPGTDDQLPDPAISADVGAGNVSAYPGIFYIVLEDLELTDYMNSVARAEMKVEYSVSGISLSALEFLEDVPAKSDPEWWHLYNANFMDAEGMHVWKQGTADTAQGYTHLNVKYHYLALPNGSGILKQIISDIIPEMDPNDEVFVHMQAPSKGRANTNLQVFASGGMHTSGADASAGGAAGDDPRLTSGTVLWSTGGGGGSVCNHIDYNTTSFKQALEDTLDPANPNVCPGATYQRAYILNPDNQRQIPGGVAWGDGWGLDPNVTTNSRFQIAYDFPDFWYTPFDIDDDMYDGVDGGGQMYVIAIVVAPGYSQQYKIPVGASTVPKSETFFCAQGDDVYFAITADSAVRVYKLGGRSFTESNGTASDFEITRMGIVNDQVFIVGNESGSATLYIYDLDLTYIDTKDSSEINALFGTTGDEFVNNVSFDFNRFIFIIGDDMYEKASLAAAATLLGDISGSLIDGAEVPQFFGLTRRGNLLAAPTFGGAMPETGVQFFTVGIAAAPGTVDLADIITQESLLAGLTEDDIDVTLIDQQVRGYRIASRGSVRGPLQQLQACFPFDVVPSGYQIKFVPRGQESVESVTYEDLGKELQWAQDREMTTQLPRKVILRYLDRDLEYEVSEQYSERPIDSLNEMVLEIPIVLTPDEAAQIVDVLHSLYLMERRGFDDFSLPPTMRALEPADVITVTTKDGASYEVRLTNVRYLPNGMLTCSGKPNAATVYVSTAKGESQEPAIETIPVAGAASTILLDTPVIDIETSPGITAVMASGYENWTGGTLYRLVNGTDWQALQGFVDGGIFGTCSDLLAEHSCHIVDRASELTVDFFAGSISSTNEDGMYNETLLAAYGAAGRWEIISFQNVTDNMDGTYTLDTFIRGMRGTEWATGLHAAGDLLVMLNEPNNEFVELQESDIDTLLTFRGVSNGAEINSQFDVTLTYAAENLTPLSPVHARGQHETNTDITITWSRRDRLDAGWENFGDVPLSEEEESYEVEILSASEGTVLRTITATAETATYTAAQQTTDFGTLISEAYINIYQISAAVGRGRGLLNAFITRGYAPAPSTWNPSDKGASITLSSSNTIASKSVAGWTTLRGTASQNAGKRYYEIKCLAASGVDLMAGIADAGAVLTLFLGNTNVSARQGCGYWGNNTSGNLFKNITGTGSATVASFGTNDIIGIAVDFTAKTIGLYKNGTLVHTHTETGTLNALFPAASLQNTSSCQLITGPTFSNLPSGYKAWDAL